MVNSQVFKKALIEITPINAINIPFNLQQFCQSL